MNESERKLENGRGRLMPRSMAWQYPCRVSWVKYKETSSHRTVKDEPNIE